MPVRSLELSVFPDRLFHELSIVQPAVAVCWASHTNPQPEKALARQLFNRSIPFFLPLYTRRGRHRNQVFVSHLPLFPGNVFLHCHEDARIDTLRTNLVVRKIPVANQQWQGELLVGIHCPFDSGDFTGTGSAYAARHLCGETQRPAQGVRGKDQSRWESEAIPGGSGFHASWGIGWG